MPRHIVLMLLTCFAASIGLHQQVPTLSAQQPGQPSLANGESINEPGLPQPWLGTWRGEAIIDNPGGKADSFQMELVVDSTPSLDRFTWRLTYDGVQGKSVRDYELVLKDRQQGHYVIDEKNGIEIDAVLIESSLMSHFSVSGQTIWVKYELVGPSNNEIIFELVTAPEESETSSGGTDEIPSVVSLRPASRQTARLKRTSTPQPETMNRSSDLISWTKLETEPYRGKQDDICFVDGRNGWYANGAGRIYRTIDGGTSWQLQHESPGTYFRCLAFLDAQHGFAGNIGPGYFPNVTDSNPLYETRDGGVTWKAVTSIEGQPVAGLCAMQVLREEFVNAGQLDTRTRIIGVGRVGGPTAMIVSDDLGATWQQIDISSHAAMAFDVFFFDRKLGFIAAATDTDVAKSHALILRTEDGGQSWQSVYESTRPYELTWKIAFPDRNVGYVTIQSYNPDPEDSNRFVAKTTDAGRTWAEVPLVSNHSVREFGIAFLDDQTGWVGAVPHGFFTQDGGTSWQKADIGNAVNKIRLLTTDSKTIGFAIGTHVYRIEIPQGRSF